MVESIAKLASQHHASEYNRTKFGQLGNPTPYLPISIRLPEHFQQLRLQQLLTSHNQAWWPSDYQPSFLSLQDQIMDAMSEPLHPIPQASFKTSLTHPINISLMIPPEIIALISSHALLSFSYSRNSPTFLEIPSPFTINRYPDLCDTRLQTRHICSPTAKPRLLAKQVIDSHLSARPNIVDALQAAITSGIEPLCLDGPADQRLRHNPENGLPLGNRVLTTFIPEASLSLSVSMNIPTFATSIAPFSDMSKRSTKLHDLLSPPNSTLKHIPSPSARDLGHNPLSFSAWVSGSGHPPCPATFPPHFAIGNLFLSSCPGKKVRLDGPIKGRIGVRRDLETDMRRIKDMGTGCIICCLDDNELEFLGAPWSEYEHCASRTGLDVLRLPIPEGLAPLAPAHIDSHLVSLINRYTLRGVPILVHCRGGVGRAGVIACCWAIRLGLCGWVGNPRASTAEDAFPNDEVLTYVEGVISFVRRQRSMKAIETYEQVKFLVDYVEYLRKQSTLCNI